jgi:hypothetical protein
VWDFDRLAEHDTLGLFEDGSLITSSTRDALIASQVASGTDRTLVFSDEGSKTVEIVVKAINRDLTVDGFTAVPPLRAVSTGVSSVTSTSAIGAGNITSDGGFAVTARGLCWGTSATPTVSGSHSTAGTGTGAFTSAITGLSGNTRYHMRAYATNSEETTYGADVTFHYDNGAPSTTASGTASSASTGWSDTTRTVSFSATDTLSGVASTRYAVDGGEPETYTVPVEIGGEDGSHVVTYGSTDASGNVETTKTAYVNIDTAPPTTSDDHLGSYYGSAIIHLSAVDTLSGPDYTRYSVDSSSAVTGTVVTCSTVGTHTLEYASCDRAGNTETSTTIEFLVAAAPERVNITTRMTLGGSARVKKGREYSLTTWMSPRSSRYHVHYTLQRWRAGGWSKVRTVTLRMASGAATYRFHPYYRGGWRIIGVYEGARTAGAVYRSSSATKRFTVY